jgi:Rod binding domain-containing protein
MDGSIKTDPSAAGLTPVSANPERKKSVEKAAEGFESYFIFSMLKEMGKTATLGEKSYAEETEMSIFYEKAADYMAKKGIGIKEAITKYLTRNDAKVFSGNGEHK